MWIGNKNHSIILSFTFHALRNFLPLIHIPPYPFVNFQNPMIYYILSLSHSWNVKCELGNNSLNNFICHLSWFRKLSPTHIHPLISICEFSKPYKLLFLEFESFVNSWMWIGKKSLNNFISHFSFLKKLSPIHTHPHVSICEFLKPYELLFLEFESLITGWM